MSTRTWLSLSDVTNCPDLVEWQPPDGSRLASGFLVGTDAIIVFLISRAGKKKMLLQTVSTVIPLYNTMVGVHDIKARYK